MVLAYSDGRWGVDVGEDYVRVRLRNIRPSRAGDAVEIAWVIKF